MKNKVGILAIFFKIIPKFLSVLAKSAKMILVGVSLAAYSYMFTWQFALIIVGMLIVHEYGHIWAMQKCGIKTKGIYLIPFFGGLALGDGMAKKRSDEVFIAMMGPLFGLGLSIVMLLVYYITDNPMFAAAASWMAMVNVINLFPVSPLDGGRVMKAIASSLDDRIGLAYTGFALLLMSAAVIFLGMWTFLILIIIGSFEMLFDYRRMQTAKSLKMINDNIEVFDEESKAKIEQINKNFADLNVEPMNFKDYMGAIVLYMVTVILLVGVMLITESVPGADLAMEMLK